MVRFSMTVTTHLYLPASPSLALLAAACGQPQRWYCWICSSATPCLEKIQKKELQRKFRNSSWPVWLTDSCSWAILGSVSVYRKCMCVCLAVLSLYPGLNHSCYSITPWPLPSQEGDQEKERKPTGWNENGFNEANSKCQCKVYRVIMIPGNVRWSQ